MNRFHEVNELYDGTMNDVNEWMFYILTSDETR